MYDFHAAIPAWSFEGLWDILCSDVIIGLGKEVIEHLPGFVLHMCMCVHVCACVMTKTGCSLRRL